MVPRGHKTSHTQTDYQYNTYNSSIQPEVQRGRMKPPARMRSGKVNLKSSAVLSQSELTGVLYRSESRVDANSNILVSARYNRRRASCVPFGLADDKSERQNVSTTEEEEREEDLYSRRMSAPELPPIVSSNGSIGGSLINNANLTSRSKTFHNYKFNNKVSQNRNSIHSDSSVQGYGIPTTTSRTSSSSSQTSRGRVLSAGTDRRNNKQFTREAIKENTPVENLKLESLDMKNGMTTVAPARSPSVTGFRRSHTKFSFANTNISTPRKLGRNKSESQFPVREQNTKKQNGLGIKRNSSDQKLTETKKNAKNSQMNGFKENGPNRNRAVSGNVGGMRKYSSHLGLNSIQGRRSDEDGEERTGNYADSDSDSEKERRVIDWLIGMEQEEREPPEEQPIDYNEDPPQRDTAIRIVYDGDDAENS